jgi:hypothetical protein
MGASAEMFKRISLTHRLRRRAKLAHEPAIFLRFNLLSSTQKQWLALTVHVKEERIAHSAEHFRWAAGIINQSTNVTLESLHSQKMPAITDVP